MKKIFEIPSIECIRIHAEEITSNTGAPDMDGGNDTVSYNPFG